MEKLNFSNLCQSIFLSLFSKIYINQIFLSLTIFI